ncbi:ASST-domain-containing protein [Lophiotrema nucula]|uniref:ASST-domain-containing protein n=1 Tax=Lophiotrema nucula TaxID=690887 RepID=A0A6A5YHH4_9PLEO|nr:ASST-domain-containing protein [Lophiotrema nucula]
MKALALLRLVAFAYLQTCFADGQYRSRPDLSPPRLNITIPATSSASPGYIFVAPYSANRELKQDDHPEQPAAYIFRDNGDLIWSSVGYLSGFVANFHVSRYRGQNVLVAFEGRLDLLHGHGYGHATLLNEHYETIKTVTGGNHKILDLHEFSIVDEKTALVEIYDQIPLDLSPYGGNETQTWIVDAIVQELDLESGDVLFEWHSLDYVSPHESVLKLGQRPLEGTTSFEAWDYFHINSVDKNSSSNTYLISGRHVSALYKLDGETGNILWQLGGKSSNFTFENEELEFAFQHDARFHGTSPDGTIEYISLFDNGAGSNGHQGGDKNKIRNFSTGKLLALNTTDWTASLVREVVHPDRVLAASQGNTQILPNNNIFVNWGQAGSVTEFDAKGEVVWNAYLDSGDLGKGVQSYRGFRAEWTGRPREVPAIIAVESEDDEVKVFVSWNGDTETNVWRFFGVGGGRRELLGEKERKGFETSLVIEKEEVWGNGKVEVFAEAVDKRGRVLSRTEVAGLRKAVGAHGFPETGFRQDQGFLGIVEEL